MRAVSKRTTGKNIYIYLPVGCIFYLEVLREAKRGEYELNFVFGSLWSGREVCEGGTVQ